MERRKARHARARKRVVGVPEKPRLSVFRSLKQTYAQVVDDSSGHTLAAASTLKQAAGEGITKTAAASVVGADIARLAREAGITRVVFDRGGFQYHGRVKALAEAAREGGLDF
jgi:large subunit ribosomal protein L18